MTTLMTQQRLLALIAAYGADPDRWPQAEREAGQEALATAGPDLRGHLEQAAQLDAFLNLAPAIHPDSALVGRVTASAQAGRAAWGRLRVWWAGAALAGLGLAGGLTGAVALALLAPPAPRLELYVPPASGPASANAVLAVAPQAPAAEAQTAAVAEPMAAGDLAEGAGEVQTAFGAAFDYTGDVG